MGIMQECSDEPATKWSFILFIKAWPNALIRAELRMNSQKKYSRLFFALFFYGLWRTCAWVCAENRFGSTP
jgi:hypothetical protein